MKKLLVLFCIAIHLQTPSMLRPTMITFMSRSTTLSEAVEFLKKSHFIEIKEYPIGFLGSLPYFLDQIKFYEKFYKKHMKFEKPIPNTSPIQIGTNVDGEKCYIYHSKNEIISISNHCDDIFRVSFEHFYLEHKEMIDGKATCTVGITESNSHVWDYIPAKNLLELLKKITTTEQKNNFSSF